MPSGIRVDLNLDAFGLSFNLPLGALADWWSDLQERAEALRARDCGATAGIVVRVQCPFCAAQHHSLLRIETSDGDLGACLRCNARFPLGA